MKIFGYVRVSGASQADKDGPVRQQLAIRDFCQKNSLPDPTIFSDLGVSGTVDGVNRPGLMKILRAAMGSPGSSVVVENMDRFARDLIVSELLVRELKDNGISLYAVDQGLVDLTNVDGDPSRKLIRQIFGAVAEFNKSMLVIKLRAARERTGHFGGVRPYGKDRPEKIFLELVVNMRKAGASWRSIATLLNQDKVRKRRGVKPWSGPEVYEVFAHRIPK